MCFFQSLRRNFKCSPRASLSPPNEKVLKSALTEFEHTNEKCLYIILSNIVYSKYSLKGVALQILFESYLTV